MSASKKGKKVVSQEELRRLMREKQRQSAEKKRVQSPFAKYSGGGQLSCGLCGVAVKSEPLWPAHVLGKQHKEKLAELKEGKSPQSQPAAPLKRRAPHAEDGPGKKARAAGESGDSSGRSAGLSLLAGVYEDDEEEEEAGGTDPTPPPPPPPPPQQPGAAGLPADFFDSSVPSAVSHSGSIQKAEAAAPAADKKDKMAEALPEGFFDDPVRDAKVRNVDAPKDHLDKEWEEFQKEIRQVNTKSEAIVAEDDEEGRLERQIDEIDEQIECYKRVELLRDRREVAVRRRASTRREREESMETEEQEEEEEEEEEEDDEEQVLGLLSQDWRAKGALA